MKRPRYKTVSHTPVWVPAPLKVNHVGDTKPGFLCIHELENGNGWCGGNVFDLEEARGDHACVVKLRGRWNISRPCYDKPHRCPGWAGGGWKYARDKFCDGSKGSIKIDYENPQWKWKTHKCQTCGVVVLPYMVRWTGWRTWWYEIKYIRNSLWFSRLENWWGNKTGRWYG